MLFWPFKLALKIVGAVLGLCFLYLVVTFVQVWLTSEANDPHPAGAAIVFGTAAGCTAPDPDLYARLGRALALYDAHLVPLIAVTGGKLPTDCHTEAQVSQMWLEHPPAVVFGKATTPVPSGRIIVGNGSDSWQNVASVAPLLRAHGVRSVLVVTDPFHEDRAMAIVSSFGFSPSATPSEHSPIGGFGLVGYFAKESAEVAVGRIIGFGTLANLIHS